MKALIFDTETTDTTDPEIVEAAWITPDGTREYHERFLPSKPISLGAMATHHIIMEDLKDCVPSSEFMLPGVEYLIGHNIDFDWRVAGEPNVKRICTLALSRYLYPEIDSHSQTAMLYHLLPHEQARVLAKGAHSALADVLNCKLIFEALVAELDRRGVLVQTWVDIWQASETARVPTVMTFGKHKGTPIAEVPSDYKRWLLGQPDVDPYLVKALRG